MQIKTVVAILAVLFIGVGYYFYSHKAIEGEWYASFRIDPDLVNEGQIESISLKFTPTGKVEYSISKYRQTQATHKGKWASQTSSGKTTSIDTMTGTYKLFFKDLEMTFDQIPNSRTLIQPFRLLGASNDDDDYFIKLKGKATVSYGQLTVSNKDTERAIIFNQDPEGYINRFYYKPEKVDHYAFEDKQPKIMNVVNDLVGTVSKKIGKPELAPVATEIIGNIVAKMPDEGRADQIEERFKLPQGTIGDQYKEKTTDTNSEEEPYWVETEYTPYSETDTPKYEPYEESRQTQSGSKNYQPYASDHKIINVTRKIKQLVYDLAQAAEDYSRNNMGPYPTRQAFLDRYIQNDQMVCDKIIMGHKIECLWSEEGYLVYAKNSDGTVFPAYTTGMVVINYESNLLSAIEDITKSTSSHTPVNLKPVNSNQIVVSWLRALSTATETYLTANGEYPYSIDDLLDASPPYINKNMCNTVFYGYRISCQWMSDGYKFIAENPSTGDRIKMSTGAVLE